MSSNEEHGKKMNEDMIAEAAERDFELFMPGQSVEDVRNLLAQAILGSTQLKDETRVVSIIGAPASGKTGLVAITIDALAGYGIAADSIGTDDYNLGTRAWRWEREREDPLSLKDFDLLNEHIRLIKAGRPIDAPIYDQKTGLAIEVGEGNFPHHLGKLDVLFVEGDFDAVKDPNLTIFVDVPAETRLRARVNRDLAERGEADAEKIAESFRSRHEKQFIPYTAPAIERADILLRVNPVPEHWVYDVYRRRPDLA